MTREPAHAGQLVAFSSGSLLNLAQGRFGPHTLGDVRWVATLAKDYGVVAVRHDSPYKTLPQLMAASKEAPGRMVFGAGGSIGSQDWMKAALAAWGLRREPQKHALRRLRGRWRGSVRVA